MASIHIKKAHHLSKEEAKQRVDGIAKDLQKKLHVDCQWKGDSLLFKRSGATGAIKLGQGFVEVKIKLGVMLTPMKAKIESSIKNNIDTYLA